MIAVLPVLTKLQIHTNTNQEFTFVNYNYVRIIWLKNGGATTKMWAAFAVDSKLQTKEINTDEPSISAMIICILVQSYLYLRADSKKRKERKMFVNVLFIHVLDPIVTIDTADGRTFIETDKRVLFIQLAFYWEK